MGMKDTKLVLLITSYLEPEHVDRIRQVDERLEVIYEPQLMRPPRYAADHNGDPTFQRTPEQEQRWRGLLARADILFDIDPTHRPDLPDRAPNARWVQATSSGIGELIKRNCYDTRMPTTVFTTASGVHGRPLAEFVVMAMLMHYKGRFACSRRNGAHTGSATQAPTWKGAPWPLWVWGGSARRSRTRAGRWA